MSKKKHTYPVYIEPEDNDKDVIASVENLRLSFKLREGGENKLVIRDTSIKLHKGEVLALVGESGSGKSVITTAMLGILGKSKVIEGGKITVDGTDVTNFTDRQWFKSKIRGKVISSVFQNPMTTLDPTMNVGKQIMESAIVNDIVKTKKEAHALAIELLDKVKLQNPEAIMKMYPHQLSGGMKQRIVIACVLIAKPKIIILDEPTTALDPTVQAEILQIIIELQKEYGVSIIFITHDLGVVASIADRVAIMYAGKVVEKGTIQDIFWNPKHPYTWGLLTSMPDINNDDRLYVIPGSVPASLNVVKGDAFEPRNIFSLDVDKHENPPFYKISDTHQVASWLYDAKAPAFEPPEVIATRWDEFIIRSKKKKGNNGKKTSK